MNTELLNAFHVHYDRLNAEQKRAVDAIEGPVMVIAGPGTGKTQILTMRIANILLKTDAHPDNVLALTFTESGGAEMRKRLIRLIGSTAYHVNIFTFHALCNEIIQAHSEDFPEHIGKIACTDLEQVRILEEVLAALPLTHLKPFGEPLYFLRPILKNISLLKKDGIDPDQFEKILEKEDAAFSAIDDLHHDKGAHAGAIKGKYRDWEKEIEKNRELLDIYREYQKQLTTAKRYDYDDMILFVIHALKTNKDLLLRLQEQYQYILVDEHQDTNHGQNTVVELLGSFHDNPNIFTVGDERQAIYSFQGASLENFVRFHAAYPSVELVNLMNNYRSLQPILDAAQELAQHNTLRITDYIQSIDYKLVSCATGTAPKENVEVIECADGEGEHHALTSFIRERIAAGTPLEEIAILYRENGEATAIAQALGRAEIPYSIESDKNVFADNDIQKLVRILRVAAHHASSSEEIAQLLFIDFFRISLTDANRIFEWHKDTKRPILELLTDAKQLQRIGISAESVIIGKSISDWAVMGANTSAEEAFVRILNESGWLRAVTAKSDGVEKIMKVRALFSELRKLAIGTPGLTIEEFVNYIDIMQRHSVPIRESRVGAVPSAVRLMTAHRSKGLEFDYVCIVNAVNGKWGGKRRREKIKIPRTYFTYPGQTGEASQNSGDDEERRLFYVALTRGRYGVRISYSQRNIDGREQIPSRFIEECSRATKRIAERPEKRDTMFTPAHSRSGWNHALIQKLFQKNSVSATALNNYIACPWKYIYVNLLRIPRVKNESQQYGTAVHAALKSFFNHMKDGKMGTKEHLYAAFRTELTRVNLEERWLKRGRENLEKYYAQYSGTWNTRTANEIHLRGQITPTLRSKQADDISITGMIDKIEVEDGALIVIDYKTGKLKSRNDIEGKTKSSNGDYKRQLVFYKLLLNSISSADEMKRIIGLNGDMPTVIEGEIDFVEPDVRGKFRKERFQITDEEVRALNERIILMAQEVRELKFANTTCGEKKCEYCALQALSRA